jgi:protein-S-isoprenylcysteine O-methyltransferase Ste14
MNCPQAVDLHKNPARPTRREPLRAVDPLKSGALSQPARSATWADPTPSSGSESVQILEARIPAPLIAVALAIGMRLVFQAEPGYDAPGTLQSVVMSAALLSSGAFALAAFAQFCWARTTIDPFKPERASTLVTHGVYRLTRNPMYVSLLLLLLAYAIELWSLGALAGPAAFVAYVTRFQILPEERALEAKFGAEFSEYRRQVRRWL